MPLVGFEPTISTGERQQTYALDGAAPGIGFRDSCFLIYLLTTSLVQLGIRNIEYLMTTIKFFVP